MQISEDVHNYMETIVGAELAKDEFVSDYSNEQLADLACLALNQLRPVYIRYDIDFLSSLPEERLVSLKKSARTAIPDAAAGSAFRGSSRRRSCALAGRRFDLRDTGTDPQEPAQQANGAGCRRPVRVQRRS